MSYTVTSLHTHIYTHVSIYTYTVAHTCTHAYTYKVHMRCTMTMCTCVHNDFPRYIHAHGSCVLFGIQNCVCVHMCVRDVVWLCMCVHLSQL